MSTQKSLSERHWGRWPKLSEEQEVTLVLDYEGKVLKVYEIAKKYGVSRQAVYDIVKRRRNEKTLAAATDEGVTTTTGGSVAIPIVSDDSTPEPSAPGRANLQPDQEV